MEKKQPKKKQQETEKPSKKVFFKNKKFVTAFIIVVASTALLGGGIGLIASNFSFDDNGNIRGGGLFSNEPKVEIKASETKNIEYDTFDNGLVSMQVPRGWTVETNQSVLTYAIHAYDPNHTERQIFAMLKAEGFNKSQEAKDWQTANYPSVAFSRMPVVNPETTEAFYKVWPQVHNLRANEADPAVNYVTNYTDFTVIENLGTTILGGDLLRASYMLGEQKVQGLFTAKVVNFGTYYVSKNIWDVLGTQGKVDVSPISVYDIFYFTTSDEDFNSWQGILDKCIGTIEYSQDFMQAHAKALQSQSELTQILSKNAQEMSDGIMDSWNKRQTSYDIMSQKQSDATLGYERVKDTETGEIYRATNGFMDSYSGSRYQSVSDNDYTLDVDGYINLK